MAVLERSYKPYAGVLSPEWSRFLIIPRHAYRDVFRSKIFTGFFVVSFVWPLVCAILIYLHYNTTAMTIIKLQVRDLYRAAAETQLQIRRLTYKRDSLEDIFLKAMENGNGGS